ncbi:hypothetical protein [Streptomyces stelliscabiei]|uniref:hypothetical protein n=1 Tax=Streptomyces stelliscabiei TaxID=146820 RepID=UPI0007C746ED
MTAVLHQAALLVTLLGLIAAACAGVRLRRVRPPVALLTDFLLAAVLIRLAADPSWTTLTITAATAALRMLLNSGLRAVVSARRSDSSAAPQSEEEAAAAAAAAELGRASGQQQEPGARPRT